VSIVRTPIGVGLTALRDGEPISQEAFQKLPEAERERIQAQINSVHEELQDALSRVAQST
jgi:N-formylglutamate amidohydrolase